MNEHALSLGLDVVNGPIFLANVAKQITERFVKRLQSESASLSS
jgi:hypothetical protein